ncbi:cilia- and flagella-associated protein 107 [Leuresthes tenuis]|uniref:cilia- and flagella-associated protein 107 n=1 Tax=Leuresthes tenuis TaxID=355514 RepID=UPI003B50A8D9
MENNKWAQTGWRIEQKYRNKVLLGNWAENRLQFTREPKIANSTSHLDYQPHWDFEPDLSVRRSALLRAEGYPYKMLIAHHRAPSSDYLVTQFQESYVNKHNNSLPALQPTQLGSSTLESEKSDWPVSALSTSSGLLDSTNHHFKKQQSHLPSLTVYRSAYQQHPLGAFCQSRFARASRMLSSHLYGANHNNRDLHLRQGLLLQVPEHCFRTV